MASMREQEHEIHADVGRQQNRKRMTPMREKEEYIGKNV